MTHKLAAFACFAFALASLWLGSWLLSLVPWGHWAAMPLLITMSSGMFAGVMGGFSKLFSSTSS